MADAPSIQTAARALLTAAWRGDARLTPKAAQFAGQVSVTGEPLSDRQLEWLGTLLDRNGLDPIGGGR